MRCLAITIALFLPLFLLTPLASAESINVSLQVGSTQVSFSGYTSPSAFLTIKEGSSTLGTTTASSDGTWTKTINVEVPGTHTYTISSSDTASRQASSLSYTLNASGNTTTSVNNIVIPPTTSLSGVIFSGLSYPTSVITITSSAGDTGTTTAGSSGYWEYNLSTLTSSSTQTIKATATVGSYLSLDSTGITYTPASNSTNSPSPSALSGSPSPSTSQALATPSPLLVSPTPSPRPFFLHLYDTNQDGKLTRLELFETIKNWLSRLLLCDLNHDNTCNLIDLSILIYYFEN